MITLCFFKQWEHCFGSIPHITSWLGISHRSISSEQNRHPCNENWSGCDFGQSTLVIESDGIQLCGDCLDVFSNVEIDIAAESVLLDDFSFFASNCDWRLFCKVNSSPASFSWVSSPAVGEIVMSLLLQFCWAAKSDANNEVDDRPSTGGWSFAKCFDCKFSVMI